MISIIVPIYNAEQYLNRCMESILKQTFQNYEILLIDDGSTDSSGKICNEYALSDGRIRVYHKLNGGSASARNLGLKEANGDYIVFIDADDIVSPDYLSLLYQTMIDNDADIVQCAYKSILSYEKQYTEDYIDAYNLKNIYTNIEYLRLFCDKSTYLSTAVLWNKLYRKHLFTDLEFMEGKGIDDEFLIYKIIFRAKRVAVISNVLYYYYLSPGSQMRSNVPTLKRLDCIDAIEQQLEFFKQINNIELYNMLLYRYYSAIIEGYYYVKKYFKSNKILLDNLKNKKKNYKEALRVKETSSMDKILLLIRYHFPSLFHCLKKVFK